LVTPISCWTVTIAAGWYRRVYKPATEAIRQEGIECVCPSPTEADLFLWLEERRRELLVEATGAGLEDVVRQVARERGKRGRASSGKLLSRR
jgi:hypothetical protein